MVLRFCHYPVLAQSLFYLSQPANLLAINTDVYALLKKKIKLQTKIT